MPLSLFFDLDNTLLDHDRASRGAARTFQMRHGELFPQPSALFARQWHDLIETAYTMYSQGLMTLAAARRWRMVQLFGSAGVALSESEAEEFVVEALADYEAHWRLYPDTRIALEHLRPFLGGIITNGGPAQQHAKVERLGLNRFFKHILISDEIGCAKPSPGIFRQAERRVGRHPRGCLFIGDTWRTDIRGALRSGWRAIWIHSRRNLLRPTRIQGAAIVASLAQAFRKVNGITRSDDGQWR